MEGVDDPPKHSDISLYCSTGDLLSEDTLDVCGGRGGSIQESAIREVAGVDKVHMPVLNHKFHVFVNVVTSLIVHPGVETLNIGDAVELGLNTKHSQKSIQEVSLWL